MKGLGEKIKFLRKKLGMTIVEVERKTGIDKATLSRMEQGKMEGTLQSHMKIAEALGIRLPELYDNVLNELEQSKDKKAKEKLETFSHSSGAVAELLTAGVLQKKMMPLLLKIKPAGETEKEEYPALTERFIFVLEGSIKLFMGQESKTLKKGESLYFSGSRAHHLQNPFSSEAQCLSVITPVSL